MKKQTVVFEPGGLEDHAPRYGQMIYCANCGKHDRVYILKGTLKLGLSVECRKCGCEVRL